MNYRICVMGYRDALELAYNFSSAYSTQDYAIISIQESRSSLMGMKFKSGGKCKAALNIHFSDIDIIKDTYTKEALDSCKNELKAISIEDADKILKFVKDLDDIYHIDNLIIHCHAGVSRSPAVAAAIVLLHDEDDRDYFRNKLYTPNMYVYRMIIKASNKFSDEEIESIIKEREEIHKEFVMKHRDNINSCIKGG